MCEKCKLANKVVAILDIKANIGSETPYWRGFENGEGQEIGNEIDMLIKHAKRILKTCKCQKNG